MDKSIRKNATSLAATALAALTLSACATSSRTPHPLEGTSWRLVDIETSGTSTQLTAELSSRHRITFEEGRMRAQLDCNRGNGGWTASMPDEGNGTIEFGPIASTRALCPAPTFGEELAASLPMATGYTLLPERSGLLIRTESAIYAFTRD